MKYNQFKHLKNAPIRLKIIFVAVGLNTKHCRIATSIVNHNLLR